MNLIKQAADNLVGHWHKDSLVGPNNTYCGLGHVAKVMFGRDFSDADSIPDTPGWDNETYCKVAKLMSDVAYEQFPERTFFPSFPTFNDHPDTTEAEVVAVMEKSAVRYDEQI